MNVSLSSPHITAEPEPLAAITYPGYTIKTEGGRHTQLMAGQGVHNHLATDVGEGVVQMLDKCVETSPNVDRNTITGNYFCIRQRQATVIEFRSISV
jgi:hypothetical protein